MVTWATFRVKDVVHERGAATWFRSSEGARRAFCAMCGTPLFFQADASPGEVDVTVGSLDHPESVTPSRHTHVASQLPWVSTADGLPRYRGDGGSEPLPATPAGSRSKRRRRP